jgi:hypothetical protein
MLFERPEGILSGNTKFLKKFEGEKDISRL